MSVQFRSVASAIASATTVVINKPAGVVIGDLLIAFVESRTGIDVTSPGWTSIPGTYNTNLYKLAGGSEPASYTFSTSNGSSTSLAGFIGAYSGVDQVNPIGAVDIAGSYGGGDVSTQPLTTTREQMFVITSYMTPNVPNATILNAGPTGFNSRATVRTPPTSSALVWVQLSDKTLPGTGGTTTPGTISVSSPNAGSASSSSIAINPLEVLLPASGDLSASASSTALATATASGLGDLSAIVSLPDVCGPLGYGGGWYGGASVYGGYGYCPSGAVTPIEPPAVKSNVVNIDDSVGRLGCGEPSFFITSRCSGTVTCVLDGLVTSATWGRKLDDVSTAMVTVDLSGDAASVCCACLSETEPWCHELHIWRDGDEVWCGPVQEIEYSYNKVVIKASDSLSWLGVRIPIVHIRPLVAEDLTTTAVGMITAALNEESAIYSCEVDNIFSQPTGVVMQVFYEAYKDSYLQNLRNIAALGLNFTTLGRTIVLVGSTAPLTPLVLLNDEHIIGDIQVTKDGTLQGNRYFVHFDGDFGVPASGEAVNKYCYNAIERILDGLGVVTGVQAGATADSYVAASAIAPRMLIIPPGSRLSPDTPWTINQMVPGARVDVAVTRLCLDLTQSFILTEVEVSYNDADGESVGITLTPLNNEPTV